MSIDTAKTKLLKEAQECKTNQQMVKVLADHLIQIMDDELAALVDRAAYTADEMGRFVVGMARKELNSKNGGLPDEVVYGYCTDYYHSTRKDIDAILGAKAHVTAPTNTGAAAKPAKGSQDPKQSEKLSKTVTKKAETVTKPADPVIKPAKKGKPQAEGQISLFDLMGGMAGA